MERPWAEYVDVLRYIRAIRFKMEHHGYWRDECKRCDCEDCKEEVEWEMGKYEEAEKEMNEIRGLVMQPCPSPIDNTFDFTAITKQMRLNADMLMKEMSEHAERLKVEFRDIRGKEALIEYVMHHADACYSDDFPIHKIETWIRQFFDERGEIEDAV